MSIRPIPSQSRSDQTATTSDPWPLSGRRTTLLLVGILFLGLSIRLLHFTAIVGAPLLKFHTVAESDIRTYWDWAQHILSGNFLGAFHGRYSDREQIAPLETWYRWWGGKEVFRNAPLFPYWVAALLGISGGSLPLVMLVQLLVGALHPLVLFGLARRLFDLRAGLIAALMTSLYGPFIFYQGVLLRDWLPPLLEPLALLALLKAWEGQRDQGWILAGAALGLALLTKETVLLFLPLAGLWVLWEHGSARRSSIRAGGLLLAGLLLCLLPLLIRNILVGAPVLALSNRAAISFIIGNAAEGTPVGWRPIPDAMRRILERSNGKLVPTIRETLGSYQGDHGAFLRRQLHKLRALADPHEISGEVVSFDYGWEISPPLRWTLRYGFIFPLAIAGLVVSRPRRREHRLLCLYLLAVVGGLLFSAIQERYRLILVPGLILYAAGSSVWFFERLRRKTYHQALRGLGLVLGLAVVQQVWMPLFKPEEYGRETERQLAAQVYASEGRFDRAVGELVRPHVAERRDFPFGGSAIDASIWEGDYRVLRARQLLKEGRREAARQQVEGAESAYAAHSDLSYPAYNLGQLYLALDEPGKAKAFFQRFLALEPEGPRADRVRALLAGRQGSGW